MLFIWALAFIAVLQERDLLGEWFQASQVETVARWKPLHGVGGGDTELPPLWVLYEGSTGMCQNSVGILFFNRKKTASVALLKSIPKAYCTVRNFSLLTGDYHCILRKLQPHSCAASSALQLHNYCFGALIACMLIHSEMRSKFKVNRETFSFLQTLLYRAAVNSTVFFSLLLCITYSWDFWDKYHLLQIP